LATTTTKHEKVAVFGLGNIGKGYEGTRHNIGFTCLDEIAQEKGYTFESREKLHALVAEIPLVEAKKTLLLVKPTTFMNLSGMAVKSIMRSNGITLKNILVIADDVELPLGRVSFKVGGGTSQVS
jgi:peptidyl-tRNA hydrolase, PTH1 family